MQADHYASQSQSFSQPLFQSHSQSFADIGPQPSSLIDAQNLLQVQSDRIRQMEADKIAKEQETASEKARTEDLKRSILREREQKDLENRKNAIASAARERQIREEAVQQSRAEAAKHEQSLAHAKNKADREQQDIQT